MPTDYAAHEIETIGKNGADSKITKSLVFSKDAEFKPPGYTVRLSEQFATRMREPPGTG